MEQAVDRTRRWNLKIRAINTHIGQRVIYNDVDVQLTLCNPITDPACKVPMLVKFSDLTDFESFWQQLHNFLETPGFKETNSKYLMELQYSALENHNLKRLLINSVPVVFPLEEEIDDIVPENKENK